MKMIQNEFQRFQEPAVHGTPAFPVGWYPRLTSSWQGYFFVPHWHEELELIYIEEGRMELVVQNQSRILIPGTIVLLPPGVLHTSYRIDQSFCRFSCVVFSELWLSGGQEEAAYKELLAPLFAADFSDWLLLVPDEARSAGADYLFKQLTVQLDEGSCFNQLAAKGLMLQLVAVFFSKRSAFPEKRGNRLREMREKAILIFMEEHYSESLQLADLAATLNLSKEQFSRFFRESFRCSPMQYLTALRIQKACQLLESSDLPIAVIAEQCGYDNGNYFAKVFLHQMGSSPSDFRKISK